MRSLTAANRAIAAIAFMMALAVLGSGQGVKRIVIIKVDGLPTYFVDQFVRQQDPQTGKSVLPWFNEIFYKNGSRVPNFYSRGMSLSGPAWGQIDTGQHLQIKGNVEYDRYTLHPYDYLGLIPFYTNYSFKKKADMPAVEVLDQLKIPLLYDMFPYEKRYVSNQLYQRGVNFENLGAGFIKLYGGNPWDFVDEWTMGLDFRNVTIDQTERDIIGKASRRPEVDYYDYYDGNFDHVSHHTSDTAARLATLKHLDRTLGRIWMGIQASSRADETAMILVSDHGFNAEDKVYSQGFNLVRLLGSAAGGGHHVVTKRRLMLDYSIKGLNPFVPLIKTGSKETYYLKDQVDAYPTALLDFDGNERSSIHLRESDLNVLHILLQQLQSPRLSADVRRAATNAFFTVIDKRRPTWKGIIDGMSEELGALHRSNETQAAAVAGLPKKYSAAEIDKGIDKEGRRVRALAAIDLENEADYTKYVETLKRLVALSREYFDPKKIKIEELIAPGAMGEHNSVYDLQNYVVGLSRSGLTLSADGSLDMARSFTHVNYFDLLQSQTVRNNVQAKLSNRPIDFLAVHIAEDTISDALPPDMRSNADAIWLYGGPEKQALILSRTDADGGLSYRFVPIAGLYQDEDGKIGFRKRELGPGFPLKMFEDPDMAIKPEDRAAWVNAWHTEVEWLRVVHKTMYSDAIVALNEQLDRHPIPFEESATTTDDERLIARFRQRQRTLTEADILIMANNHWNFDVRGFNPGGNHGSFFRVSTNSIFMMAGGSKTGIPRGLAVEDPYDSLSVVPTILALMGKIDDQKRPNAELAEKGYKRFPGRVVKEIVSPSPK